MKRESFYKQELYWICQSNAFVSMYMKYDFFNMNEIAFVAKYILEMKESKLEEKKKAISEVLNTIWKSMETAQKYAVLTLLSKGRHTADSFHLLLFMNDVFECEFLETTISKTYTLATNYDYTKKLKAEI